MQRNHYNYAVRYLAIVALFCVVCVVYLGRLFYIQISGREGFYGESDDVEYIKVQSSRGEIYDRNGNKLVENHYTYDLILSVDFLRLDAHVQNGICLDVLSLVEGWEHLRPNVFSPFGEGQEYPFYSYADGVESSATHQGVITRLQAQGLKKTDANSLKEFYVKLYDLLAVDDAGARLYSDRQIDTLIRTYYDMDAHRFYHNGEYVVAKGLEMSDGVSADLMTSVLERTLATVELKYRLERVYCYPGYASHILGTIGPIFAEEWEDYRENGYQMDALVGKSGCEAAFEQYLHGTDGLLKVEKGKDGVRITTVREPVAGKDVYLTIDIELQIAAEDALAENVRFVSELGGEGVLCDAGAVVAIDPETFEVLAIASHPTYDLGVFNESYDSLYNDPSEPLRNRAINEAYAPGSTLKLGMALIALNEGKITPNERISCTGKYRGSVGCSTYGENHWGNQNVIEAITHSCNSFFCEIGDRFKEEDPLMEDYLSRLGLGQHTGLELGGAKGIMAGPTYRATLQNEEGWGGGMRWSAAIGQSDHRMSPLQLAAYTGTVCNGGVRYETRLLHSVRAFGTGEVLAVGESEILSQTDFSKDALDTVRKGMRTMVAESSYAIRENYLGLSKLPQNVMVGGKTGTAQVGGDNPDNALFVCEATTDGESIPDVVVSVVLEQGAHGYYAARTAGAVLNAFYN